MADNSVSVTEGSGKDIDTRTNAAGDHRQVIVVGNPSATDSVAEVQATDPNSSGLGLVVREPNTTAIVSGLRDIRVQSIVDGTVSLGARADVQRVFNVVDGTISLPSSQDLDTITRVDRVMNVVDGTISLPSTQDLDTITRVDRVMNVVDGTISLPSSQDLDTITRVDRVHNIVDGTISLGSRPDVQRVHNVVDGTMSVNDLSGTATIPQSLEGSASGVSASGNTIKSPISGRVIKVYAINLTTTAQAHVTAKFGDGGDGGTKFWRYALQAPSQGIAGANLAVSPPGYLFATAAGSTLALHLDTASLVHFSVSYFLESA